MARENRATFSVQPSTPRRSSPTMRDSLQGSAKVDTLAARNAAATDGQNSYAQSKAWQQRMWSYFHDVGEFSYAMGFIGNCLSRCNLTIGVRDKNGKIGPAFDEKGQALAEGADTALDIVRSLNGPTGGQAQLMWALGANLAGPGEAYLVGSPPDGISVEEDDPAPDIRTCTWEVLSTQELQPNGKDYKRFTPGTTAKEVPGNTVHVVRIWRSDPEFSALPWSSARAVLDILEELYLLTREVNSDTKSRLSNGKVFCVPIEIEMQNDDNADSDKDGDPFVRDMVTAFATPIADKASASGLVPYVLRAPADLLHPDKLRTIDLSRANPSDSAAKRVEAVQRLAQGLDLPVEIVTGHANTTFSNAVQIDDSLFKSHIEPLLDVLVDALSQGFLRPALELIGMKDSPFVVHYDSSELVARPNRAQDAKDGYDRYEISGATLRTAIGFSEGDAPDAEEIARRIEIKQLTQVRQTVPTTPAGVAAEDDGVAAQDDGSAITQGPLDDTNNTDKVLNASVFAMAELAVEQAIERAGGRLRYAANQRQPAVRQQLAQVQAAEVAVTLGPALVAKLVGQDDLFHEQFDKLWNLTVRMTGDQNYADQVREACLAIAGERLYQPRAPFPFVSLPRFSERGVVSVAA